MSLSMEDGAAELVLRSRAGDQNATAMIAVVRENAMREPKPGDKKDADLVARAKRSFHLIREYIKLHPVPGANLSDTSVVRQVNHEARTAQVLVNVPKQAIDILKTADNDGKILSIFSKLCHYSNGPKVAVSFLVFRDNLHVDRLNDLMKLFSDNEAHMRCFTYGVKHPQHPEAPMLMAQTRKDCFYPLVFGMLVGRAKAIQDKQRPPESAADDSFAEGDES